MKYRVEMTVEDYDNYESREAVMEQVQSAMLLGYPIKLWSISVTEEQKDNHESILAAIHLRDDREPIPGTYDRPQTEAANRTGF